jgi:hypothetical protein
MPHNWIYTFPIILFLFELVFTDLKECSLHYRIFKRCLLDRLHLTVPISSTLGKVHDRSCKCKLCKCNQTKEIQVNTTLSFTWDGGDRSWRPKYSANCDKTLSWQYNGLPCKSIMNRQLMFYMSLIYVYIFLQTVYEQTWRIQ